MSNFPRKIKLRAKKRSSRSQMSNFPRKIKWRAEKRSSRPQKNEKNESGQPDNNEQFHKTLTDNFVKKILHQFLLDQYFRYWYLSQMRTNNTTTPAKTPTTTVPGKVQAFINNWRIQGSKRANILRYAF